MKISIKYILLTALTIVILLLRQYAGKVAFLLLTLTLSSGFISGDKYKVVTCYGTGEELQFRVHYGMINAGEATLEVGEKLYLVNEKVCYKASVTGKSTGAFDFMLKIRDTWGSYIDTVSHLPQKSFRNVEEGKYRLKETSIYNYKQGVINIDRETRDSKEKLVFKIPLDVQDIVSGYYYLRSVEYTKYRIGDTIGIQAFFDNKLYDFRVRYMGKCQLECKFGTIAALKVNPIMPPNGFFKDGNAVNMWLSDDRNRIPLKIEAQLRLGSVDMDLKDYKRLRYPINFKKD
ncbi:MAG TPA: DUF3108 domain-containing protein [Cytophagaceae bacterium]|jgi:hypothetical protein